MFYLTEQDEQGYTRVLCSHGAPSPCSGWGIRGGTPLLRYAPTERGGYMMPKQKKAARGVRPLEKVSC